MINTPPKRAFEPRWWVSLLALFWLLAKQQPGSSATPLPSLLMRWNQWVMFLGLKKAAQPPDEDHPYGHGKAEPMAAIVVMVGLTVAAGFIAYESIINLSTRHLPPKWYTLVVLALVIIIKETLSRYVSGVGESVESQAIQADAFHHRSDAITFGAAKSGMMRPDIAQ